MVVESVYITWGQDTVQLIRGKDILFFFFFFFCLFFRAALAAYGSSQARGQIRAAATATAMQDP